MTAGLLPGNRRVWLVVAAAGVAGVAAALVPPPSVVADDGGRRAFAALASIAVVAVAMLPFVMWRGARRPAFCLAAAGAALAAGSASFYAAGQIERTCTAGYGDTRIIIGGTLTPEGAAYRQANLQLSTDELLFDAAGVPERLWTADSIRRCRGLITSTYVLWVPFLVISLAAAAQGLPHSRITPLRWDAPAAAGRLPAPPRYDVFISYRHGGADTTCARELLDALEASGYRVAIDERDFPANASFLEEMERCIRESRFTVAVISAAYLESGNCQEEAIICKVLDMGDRRRRLIPFVMQPVPMPTWLYGIVGIDATKADPLVDPIDRLRHTIGAPAAFEAPTS